MNKIMLLIIVLTTLSGCVSDQNKVVYPVLIYSETYDGIYTEYYKRKNGTQFMRFKLNSGVVREMDMAK